MVLLLQVADSLRSVLLLHVTGRDDAPCRTIQSPKVTAGLLQFLSLCFLFLFYPSSEMKIQKQMEHAHMV